MKRVFSSLVKLEAALVGEAENASLGSSGLFRGESGDEGGPDLGGGEWEFLRSRHRVEQRSRGFPVEGAVAVSAGVGQRVLYGEA